MWADHGIRAVFWPSSRCGASQHENRSLFIKLVESLCVANCQRIEYCRIDIEGSLLCSKVPENKGKTEKFVGKNSRKLQLLKAPQIVNTYGAIRQPPRSILIVRVFGNSASEDGLARHFAPANHICQ